MTEVDTVNAGNTGVTQIRPGCSDAEQGTACMHTLVVLVHDRPGSVDRVVGVLRRRRAKTLSLNLCQSETPDVVRITALVKDSEVGVDHLIEHLRKIVDVRQVSNLVEPEAVQRELFLVKVTSTASSSSALIETAQRFGACAVAIAPEAVTFEVAGNEEKLSACLDALRPYGIRELARSGSVAVAL